MDVETKALIDLSKYNLKLVSRKDFNMNVVNDELKNNIKLFQVYEYELETKARKVWKIIGKFLNSFPNQLMLLGKDETINDK